MDNQIVRVVKALCDDIATPRAKLVKELFIAGEVSKLQELRVVPSDYTCSETYWRDAMVTELFRKCKLPGGNNTKAEAEKTFLLCEKQNALTNIRLSRYLPETLLLEDTGDMRVLEFIALWRKEISFVLGRLPSTLTTHFSGGATYGDVGFLKTIPDKMSSTPQITSGAMCLLPFWQETAWYRARQRDGRVLYPDVVRGNVFFTVPKNAHTDRGCCKEASLNIGFQLDAGRRIRTKLLRIGIDIQGTKSWPALGGQLLHRSLAQRASMDQSLATIDMSNASDLIARVLPKLVLPTEWFDLLNSLRSPITEMGKKSYYLEKFSSMGCGFTFELETLLFSTLARVIISSEGGDPQQVKCYGDDLIVESQYYRAVTSGLRMFGFVPNMKKTFSEGPFRESCGGDFYEGVPVRAAYLEELPDEPQHWIALANSIRRVATSQDCPPSRWGYVRRSWLRCLDAIPTAIRRCRGPVDLGDIVIHDDPEHWARAGHLNRRRNIPGWDVSWMRTYVRCYSPVSTEIPWKHWTPNVQMASCTLGIPSTGVTPRDMTGYKLSWAITGPRNSFLPIPRVERERASQDSDD